MVQYYFKIKDSLKLGTLSKIVDGQLIQHHSDAEIKELITDSRKVPIGSEEGLFIAISGDNHNGHDFIQNLYEKGVRNFIVEYETGQNLPKANVLKVKNSLVALQKIASHHRKQFEIPVIGITGSNGKTIVKEWLWQCLSIKHSVYKSPGSYNSQLGVPLSVWQMSHYHDLAILEAGISTVGEMQKLEGIIHPTIGIITNIGSAHDQGFESRTQKIYEKLKLFSHSKTLIFCNDHDQIKDALDKLKFPSSKRHTWSTKGNGMVNFESTGGSIYRVFYCENEFRLRLPFLDTASQENLMHCISTLLYFNFDAEEIQDALNGLETVKMRLEVKQGVNGCYLIDDTYNNDLAGLKMAIDFLKGQTQRKLKTLILSDILQQSTPDSILYSQVSKLVKDANITRLIGIGPNIEHNDSNFSMATEFYESTDSFLSNISDEDFSNEIILIKGARTFQFERIVNRLSNQVHETVLEIDLDALVNNLNFYRSRLNKETKLMVMVKALAYGSGAAEISGLLQFHKVDYLGVAYTDEGVELRKNGISIPIMVMNPKDDMEELLKFDLEPELFGLNQLRAYASLLSDRDRSLRVHFNINTGMNRLGFEPHEVDEALEIINVSKIEIASVFTHLAGADESEHEDFTRNQISVFSHFSQRMEEKTGKTIIKHVLNSAGIMNYPEYQFDMVRLGIGLHGIDPTNQSTELMPVSTMKTVISQIKRIKKGETIGYSRKGKANEEMKIATIAIGYADGFQRAFSNGKGHVLINGQAAPVIGNVCMDMTMVDIKNIEAKEGDEVIIFGSGLPIGDVAESIGTIPYEILTNVSSRVRRLYHAS